MARWKLITPHYLNTTDDLKYEYTETDRTTGRPKKFAFPVPRFIDPADPADWNVRVGRDDGMVVVTNGGTAEPGDIKFFGDPSPDMVPMDAEAEAITAKLSVKWNKFGEAQGSYGDALVREFETQQAEVQSKPQTVQVEGMNELLQAIGALLQQNHAPKQERRV